jgi:hypothetical protein
MSWVAGVGGGAEGAADALHHHPDGFVGGGRRLVAVLAVDMGDGGDAAAECAGLQPAVRQRRDVAADQGWGGWQGGGAAGGAPGAEVLPVRGVGAAGGGGLSVLGELEHGLGLERSQRAERRDAAGGDVR